MTSPGLSPGLAELLLEVPADGGLMRVTPEQLVRGLRQGVEWARTRQTGLLPAEEELLRRHREELAEVLLDVCYVRLHDGEAGKKFGWSRSPSLARATATSSRWSRVVHCHAELRRARTAEDLLRAGSVTCLAHISQRIVPSIRALFVQAADCTHLRSQPKTAYQIYHKIDQLRPEPRLASMAANNLAQLHEMGGSAANGLRVIQERACPEDLLTSVNLFVFGADLGEEAEFLRGLNLFADVAIDNPTAADEVIATRRQVMRSGAWRPTPKARSLALRAEADADGWQRKLIDVLL